MGFSSPTRCVPTSPPPVSRPEAPLLGFRRPYNARGGESPRPVPVARFGPPGCAGVSASESHFASYGAARRFSQPLSGFFLSPPSRHFQTGGVRGVLPFRELFLPRSPDDSSPPACPLDVPPAGCAVPILGGDVRGHTGRFLGWFDQCLLSPSGLSSSWKSICINESRLMSR